MQSKTDRGQLILDLAEMFPTDLSHTSDQLVLVDRITSFIMDREALSYAEGMMASHAQHELQVEEIERNAARRVRDAWEAGYREGYDDGKEGRFHQVNGKE
jgi:hypothetical protein